MSELYFELASTGVIFVSFAALISTLSKDMFDVFEPPAVQTWVHTTRRANYSRLLALGLIPLLLFGYYMAFLVGGIFLDVPVASATESKSPTFSTSPDQSSEFSNNQTGSRQDLLRQWVSIFELLIVLYILVLAWLCTCVRNDRGKPMNVVVHEHRHGRHD